MEDIVRLAIVASFVVLVVVIGSAFMIPEIEGLLTDQAELEIAKGKRAALELDAKGEYEVMRAAAKAIRADTRLVSTVFAVLVVVLVVNVALMGFVIVALVGRREI